MLTVRRIGIRSYYLTAALATLTLLLLFWLRGPLLNPPRGYSQMWDELQDFEINWITEDSTPASYGQVSDDATREGPDEHTLALRQVLYSRDLILITHAPLLWVWLANLVSLAGVFRLRLRLAAGSEGAFTLRRVGLLWAIAFGALSGLVYTAIGSQLEFYGPSDLAILIEAALSLFETTGYRNFSYGLEQMMVLGEPFQTSPLAPFISALGTLRLLGQSTMTGPLTPFVAGAIASSLTFGVTIFIHNRIAAHVRGLELRLQRRQTSLAGHGQRHRLRLTHIRPVSALRVGALTGLILQLCFLLPVAVLVESVFLHMLNEQDPDRTYRYSLGLTIDPLTLAIYTALVVFTWPLWALIYNWLARRFGGLVVEVAGAWPVSAEAA